MTDDASFGNREQNEGLNIGYRQLLEEKTHGQFKKENIQQHTVEDLKGLSIQHGFKQYGIDHTCP